MSAPASKQVRDPAATGSSSASELKRFESDGIEPRRPRKSKHEDGFRKETTRIARASYYFIQREQARKAWLIFFACVAFASVPFTSHWPGVRQGAIVLASLAAGAIFLPELNSGLWRLNAEEIRATIPEHKRRAFHTELIRADCPDDEWAQRWATLMWHRGVIPLLDAAKDTSRIHWNMSYSVSVHLHQEMQVGRRRQAMARVETLIDDERVLPVAEGPLWVSIAGNDASLLSEFNEPDCIARELVCLPGLAKKTWANEVQRHCRVRVQIGSRTAVFGKENIVTVPGDEKLKIVRWLIPVLDSERDGTPVSCQVEMRFPTELRESNFPALFAGYYCAGKTQMTFRLYHGNGPRPQLRYFDEFLSEGGGDIAAWKPEKYESDEQQSVTYRTPPNSLLWPGSGIYFWWEFPES
jgi:hypothetical protein